MTITTESQQGATEAGIARMPGFYKLTVHERIEMLQRRGPLNESDAAALLNSAHQLQPADADKMIENVIGVLGLPIGVGLNFRINGRDYVVPLAVEEPSIVAALSAAAKLIGGCGGFRARSTDPVLMGQVQLVDLSDPERARAVILEHAVEILELANNLAPNMRTRGGGAREITAQLHHAPESDCAMLVACVYVDTRDAMGANLIDTICEGIAPRLEELTGGRAVLRILSNLSDRSMVHAEAIVSTAALSTKGRDGARVRDDIILANDLARVDPYRAATHNKGIMNGIDAVALATGNDWRALEAGAHAYAARDGSYRALTRWHKNQDGDLVGELEIPIKVGTVGGNLQSNPTTTISRRLLGATTAPELAEVMGAVGLAQNFSALKALVTDGIQRGHMSLHARSVALAAHVPAALFDQVVAKLLQSGEIKLSKARAIVASLQMNPVENAGATDKESGTP